VNPTLLYASEAYSTTLKHLMGRNSAGESFLNGLLAYGTQTEFRAMVANREEGQRFAHAVSQANRQAQATRPVKVFGLQQANDLAESGVLHIPDPNLQQHAWQRSLTDNTAWSLTGITHTLSSHSAMDLVTGLLTAPVQEWDALICTSESIKKVVHNLLGGQAEFLRSRLQIQRLVLPQLPVIPLGVMAEDFSFTPHDKANARKALGIPDDTVVVLYVGRLSFHAKAHPLPMYRALQSIASRQKVVLLELGRYNSVHIKKAFDDLATLECPHLDRRVLDDSEQPGLKERAWACADVFCSLSDNFQESFGITPVEAMASGLPVVVSDWDGYRESVQHGVQGFLVPTTMPPEGLGQDLITRYAIGQDNYDHFMAYSSSFVAVDVPAATHALETLICNPDLRLKMGEAGRQRVKQQYDWSVLIPQYEALWAELQTRRQFEKTRIGGKSNSVTWPARRDLFGLFQAHASQTLSLESVLKLHGSATESIARLQALRQQGTVNFTEAVLPTLEEMNQVLEHLATRPGSVLQLLQAFPEERRALVFRALTWLLKVDLVTFYQN
jgi:starch synthase